MAEITPPKEWDGERLLFTSKQAATSFAGKLAEELGISPKAVQVEGKKGEFHVFCGYVTRYWMPTNGWDTELEYFKLKVKEANENE